MRCFSGFTSNADDDDEEEEEAADIDTSRSSSLTRAALAPCAPRRS